MVNAKPILVSCELCGAQFQFGSHVYRGKVIANYKLTVCSRCWEGNSDGFASHFERILEAHWNRNDIPVPTRNSKGWYPRGD